MKKLFISLGALTAVVFPISMTVACGDDSSTQTEGTSTTAGGSTTTGTTVMDGKSSYSLFTDSQLIKQNIVNVDKFKEFAKSWGYDITVLDPSIQGIFKESKDVVLLPGALDSSKDADQVYGDDDFAIFVQGTPEKQSGKFLDNGKFFDVAKQYDYSDTSSTKVSFIECWGLEKEDLADVSNIIYLQVDKNKNVELTMDKVAQFDDGTFALFF